MYTIDDIQIFITTHNRANYLKQSIESILNQTVNVKEIIVLDNESTDNTEEIVTSFANKGVKYIKTFGFLGNFKKAREIVNKPYCMLFHDDDILHPEYLKFALKILNKYKNISLITTRYTEFWNDNCPQKFKNIKQNYYLFKDQKDFAAHMFFIECIAYATAIYKTKDFLKTDLEYDKYSKFNDWPFMVKIAERGHSVLIDAPNVFYVRRHDQQDTCTNTNTISFDQIINWDKLFYDIFLNSKDPELLEMYRYKSEYFIKGKYDLFVSKQAKENFSYEELLILANKLGLKDISRNKTSMISISNEYTSFTKKLKEKYLHRPFLKECFKLVYKNFICGTIFSKLKKYNK